MPQPKEEPAPVPESEAEPIQEADPEMAPELPENFAAETEPTPEPMWEGVTNMDLAEHVLSLRHALGLCNSDKKAIRS